MQAGFAQGQGESYCLQVVHCCSVLAEQVRQKLYTSAVGKWRHYEQQLQPAYRLLRDLIERYEDDLKDLQSSSRATDEL